MTNYLTKTACATIRRHCYAAGYSPKAVADGIAYAEANCAAGARDGYVLTMSRILYSDDQLADGSLFSVDAGVGPQ